MAKNRDLFPDDTGSTKRRRSKAKAVVKGKVKVHDPFELVRWLALSQPDPRKALAELVQNSLDAEATTVRVTRVRQKKLPCLVILDDGEGVIPELDRPEALRYVATHIGHSRKQQLSPEERLTLMTQGQYGIGLLGFWTLGQMLEIRSAVPGQTPHRLVLHRDRPDFVIERLRRRSLYEERFTEVVVVDLHREAQRALSGRRAADYLAVELRGQLLSREVELVVEDRMARGRAEKIIPVRPRPFLGEPISEPTLVPVPGHPPIRFELYLRGETSDDGPGGVAVYAAGTLVAGGFDELAAIGLDRRPWTDDRLGGLVDFPGLRVAPGSRRGIVPDEAAEAFETALRSVEPKLHELLEEQERRRAEDLDKKLIKELQRAFRGFYRQQPRYTLLPVQAEGAGQGPGDDGEGEGGEGPQINPGTVAEVPAGGAAVEPALPFAPGPLEAIVVTPDPLTLRLGATRAVTARPVDVDGRRVEEHVSFRWWLSGRAAAFADDEPDGERVRVRAGEVPGTTTLSVHAWTKERQALTEVPVEVTDAPPKGRTDEGIPEPELIEHPGAQWRSRIVEGQWQVNSAHPEFRAIRDRPALKVRYLAMLFAKEVVLRSAQDPRLDKPLEQLVEIAAFADRNLAKGRRSKR